MTEETYGAMLKRLKDEKAAQELEADQRAQAKDAAARITYEQEAAFIRNNLMPEISKLAADLHLQNVEVHTDESVLEYVPNRTHPRISFSLKQSTSGSYQTRMTVAMTSPAGAFEAEFWGGGFDGRVNLPKAAGPVVLDARTARYLLTMSLDAFVNGKRPA